MAVSDIKKGDILTQDNTALLRSEKSLSPGLPPDYLPLILGRRASTDIPSGKGITSGCL